MIAILNDGDDSDNNDKESEIRILKILFHNVHSAKMIIICYILLRENYITLEINTIFR